MATTSASGFARVRPAAVAGAFYPGTRAELVRVIDTVLREATGGEDTDLAPPPSSGPGPAGSDAAAESDAAGARVATVPAAAGRDPEAEAGAAVPATTPPDTGTAAGQPKALIVPHAGYVYSGPVAAHAYARLLPWREVVTRVVLLGPAHRVPVRSMAVSSADAWDTPLGPVPVAAEARDRILALPGVVIDDRAHAPEHSLEVEVPFLQRVLGDFELLPIVVGEADERDVAGVLDALWGGPETLIVISSDLSHYHDYATARDRDRRTADNILAGRTTEIGPYDACGAFPVRGLLEAARDHRLGIELVDLRNSGDTAGPDDRVVGYGSFVLTEQGDGGTAGGDAGGSRAARLADPAGTPHAAPTDVGAATREPGIAETAEAQAAAATADALLTDHEQALVLDVAIEAIRSALEERPPTYPELGAAAATLLRPAATFVTLRHGDRLLGCIGTLEPRRPLVEDVADNALGAAFRDPRMPQLTPWEFELMSVHVSVLSEPVPLPVASLDELRAVVVPGEDGLVIEAGRNRGTFLPSVWEQIDGVDQFLTHLWLKAGLRPASWPDDLVVSRYRTVEFGVDGPRAPIARAKA